jgi:hypothetical protein
MSKKKHEHAGHAEKSQSPTERPVPVTEKPDENDRSRSIRIRAYALWEQAGKPDGDATREHFWREAEQEFTMSPEGSR